MHNDHEGRRSLHGVIETLKEISMGHFIFAATVALLLAMPTSASADAIDEVRLRRTMCYGHCPAYSVSISKDGSVTYQGEHFVRVEGEVHSTLSARDWAFLLDAIDRIHFFQLRDRYQSRKDGCAEISTDNPSIEISATGDAGVKQVVYDQGCEGVRELPSIRWLADTIDQIAETWQWVSE